MRNDRVVNAYANIAPDAQAKEHMLANILAKRKVATLPKHKKRPAHWVIPAACAAAVLLLVAGMPQFRFAAERPAVLQQVAPGADSPKGMRKFMNYDGLRYVFLENGAVYDLQDNQLSQEVGMLEHDITQNPENYHAMEFASTFAVGGTIYEMEGYDPAFRLAVEMDGQYYLCQSVDTVDNAGLNLKTYFETAALEERVQSIQICDHTGQEVLAEVSPQNIQEMISILSGSTQAELTEEQYQQIGKAQQTGGSFLLKCGMNDGTTYQMYVIPSLSMLMAGDSKYVLPDAFLEKFGPVFDSLNQHPSPME